MTSILTNNSAMTALQNLAQTQQSLAKTQQQISSGLKVGSAQDDAAYWSISQTMRTNVSNLSAVTDSLNLGSSVLSTATSATNNIYSVLQSISKNLVSAAQPGTDLNALQTSINTLRQQLASTVATASFNGVNMLDASNGNSVSFVGGITGQGASTSINSISISTSQTNMNGANYVAGSNALAKTAETADAALVAGQASNAAAFNALVAAASQLTPTDYANTTTAFQNVFGTGASYASGKVTGINGSGAAAALVGTGTGASITISSSNNSITGYTNGTSPAGGTLTAIYGTTTASGTTATSTTAATPATGSVAQVAAAADAAALAVPAAKTAYLVDNAAAAVNANAAAESAYTTAQTAFTTAVAGLTSTDYTSGTAAFKAVFGNNATYNSGNGTVTGMAQGSTAATLMGTAGTYTMSTGTYSQTGSSATTGGALYTLYGAGGTSSTTDATATGGTALAAKNAVTAVNNDAAGSAIFNGGLFAISQINLVGASSAQIQSYTAQVGQALQTVTTAQEVLGAASSNLTVQTNYTSSLSDALTSGVGSLVDADMNEASTRLQALQTQQQLGIQSLSIANQNSQLILKLFQG